MCLTERFFVMAEVRDHLKSLGDAEWLAWDARCMLLYQHLFWRTDESELETVRDFEPLSEAA